jgi:hypothetical protein
VEQPPIATLSLLGRLAQNKEEFPVTVSIGKPYLRANGSWACPVELTGLAAFVRSGGRLRNLGDDPEDSFSLGTYFGVS